jgi:hypothetical protein
MGMGKTVSWITAGLDFGQDLKVMTCPTCSIVYAVPEQWRQERERDHRGWSCPNKCDLHYPREASPETKRIKQLEQALEAERNRTADANRSRDWAQSRAKGANIAAGKAKAAARRLKERVAAGVCPCCQRTFKQLAAHMKSKHPEVVG